MKISSTIKFQNDHFSAVTHKLQQKMVSPLCGLVQRVSYMNRSTNDATFMTAGGELTGVHILRNQKNPGPNAYHIGGGGFLQDEPLIRVLAESAERYAQLTSALYMQSKIKFHSFQEGAAMGLKQISKNAFTLFGADQYEEEGFPFTKFSEDVPMGWIKMQSLTHEDFSYVPAQFSLVGYVPRVSKGEQWLFSAVSTGSAAHVSHTRALRSGILELIQIDAAMGHWYSDALAPRIIFDNRTKRIEKIIKKQFNTTSLIPTFYYLKSADLPGISVACIVRDDQNLPAASVGLGCDMTLESAMYKALLEAVAVVQLVKLNLLYLPKEQKSILTKGGEIEYLNFDSNVARYAFPVHAKTLEDKFISKGIPAQDLPADSTMSYEEELQHLIDAFKRNNFDLFGIDMTTPEIDELGIKTVRAWSPNTLALCLPTRPQERHVRFAKYGGCTHFNPHPYA